MGLLLLIALTGIALWVRKNKEKVSKGWVTFWDLVLLLCVFGWVAVFCLLG